MRDKAGLMALAAAGGAVLVARAVMRRSREYDFRGKVVLISGSSRGLGLVIARQLADQGARIMLAARSAEDLEEARRDVEARGAQVAAIPADTRDPHEAEHLIEETISRFGRIDVLINVAGTITVGPVESMTLDDYREQMESNYWSAVHTCYYAVPHMQRQREGRIVNVSSIGGKIAVPHLLPYCAGKFALTGFSRGLRAELQKDGILVTTVCPGLMRTGSPRNANFKSQNEAEYAWFSISDSIPGLSMSAKHAAHDLIEATRRGEVEIVLSLPAKMAVLLDQIFPEWSGDVMGFAGRMMPALGGIGTFAAKGKDSQSAVSPSPLTALTEKAARENNEV